MIKGCREPPYPSVLTDATMEKLALAKFVAQESKCEVSGWEETPVAHHWPARGIFQSPGGRGFPPLGPILLSTGLCPKVTLFSWWPFLGLGSG